MTIELTSQRPIDRSGSDSAQVWRTLLARVSDHLSSVGDLPAVGAPVPEEVAAAVDEFFANAPIAPAEALEMAFTALQQHQHNVRHPRYFGLFDAAPTPMSVAGETIASVFNACLSTRAASQFGVAAEERLITEFGTRFGYRRADVDGIFTSGGSESNHSALLLALSSGVEGFRERGLIGVARRPIVYVTEETHGSVEKAARLCGLGGDAVHRVVMDSRRCMSPDGLRDAVMSDRRLGLQPLIVVATAGTTGVGAIDPIADVVSVAEREGLWTHVDAAWAGAAALLPERRHEFAGLEHADSIAFDPHKWLAVPLGAGMLLTRHPGALERAFNVIADYVDLRARDRADPYQRSMRWSRGFVGLKLLLLLATAGWDALEEMVREQVELGATLRELLAGAGWSLVNDTPLPIVCFRDGRGADSKLVGRLVNESGKARIAVLEFDGAVVLRLGITNYATRRSDIDEVVELLDEARTAVSRLDVS